MNTRLIYEAAIKNMTDMLRQTVNNFSVAHLSEYDYFQAQPLFSITSPQFSLLKAVSDFSNYQIRNEMAGLCRRICDEFGQITSDGNISSNVDFFVILDGVKIGYHISMVEEYMPQLDEAVATDMKRYVNVVLKNNVLQFKPNSQKYRDYPHKEIVQNLSLHEFFESIQPGEFEVFKEYIRRFNYEAELLLGLTITPRPTQKALDQKWEKIKEELRNGVFESSMVEEFSDNEMCLLKHRFSTRSLLDIPKASFVDSFVSSEWYYDLLDSTDGQLEQTAIVAGYLKSIEQLLFSMMLSRSEDLEFRLWKNDRKTLEVLSLENHHQLLTMAGKLLSSIEKNYGGKLYRVFVDETIGNKVISYLNKFFKHTRNGYFHKDNIYTMEEIKTIRVETYSAFFLLGASFEYSFDKLNQVCCLDRMKVGGRA